ncbi:MAG: hypothetical protein CPDRYMAC_6200 [uncultured Paraburkholderia sp.]|nr:MAG: hypothetical protein CPDRYDRY_6091 [uncultured Paraburkholderia sp.]CAH2943853.1 MAG: hypothetical protein CPDRYMAC_6200 [uncultured Paraburkholderia sp.]
MANAADPATVVNQAKHPASVSGTAIPPATSINGFDGRSVVGEEWRGVSRRQDCRVHDERQPAAVVRRQDLSGKRR